MAFIIKGIEPKAYIRKIFANKWVPHKHVKRPQDLGNYGMEPYDHGNWSRELKKISRRFMSINHSLSQMACYVIARRSAPKQTHIGPPACEHHRKVLFSMCRTSLARSSKDKFIERSGFESKGTLKYLKVRVNIIT